MDALKYNPIGISYKDIKYIKTYSPSASARSENNIDGYI
jgi:hypothetical protein